MVTTLDLTGVPVAQRSPSGADVRARSLSGAVIPAQAELAITASDTSLELVAAWDTAAHAGGGHVYLGTPDAVVPGGALSTTLVPGTSFTVTRDALPLLRVDLSSARAVNWGKANGAITGLWDGTTTYVDTAGAIRHTSLGYNGGNTEGEMGTTTVAQQRLGPAAALLELTGNDVDNRFQHRVRYLVFADNTALVRGNIHPLNNSTGGMDINRAPLPAILGLAAGYPTFTHGEAASEGWMNHASPDGARHLGLVIPGSPSTVVTRLGHPSSFTALNHTIFPPGFGGWRMRPNANNGQYGGIAGGLTGDAPFTFVVTWGPSSTLARSAWQRLSSPPTVTWGAWEALDTWSRPEVAHTTSFSCARPLAFSTEPAASGYGLQLSRDGTTFYTADSQGWLDVSRPGQAASVADTNAQLASFPTAVPGIPLQIRVVVPLLPAAPPLQSVTVTCAP